MIRIFKLVLLLVVSQVTFGQAPSNYTNINGRYRWIAGMFDSTFHIPKGTSPSLRTGGSTNAGGLFYNTSDSSVYTYTGTQWIKARGSINPSDTTNKYVTQVYKKNASDSVFYVKGGIHTWAFNDSTGSPGGGGGGKVYYFNGGVNMGTFGGLTMYELGDTANTGAAANFTRATTGAIANFITDPNKPGLLQIPAGSWTIDAWLSETGGGANHAEIWIEVEKWDGSTITTIATSPIEQITEGSTPNLYSWSVSIPTTSLTVTDRIIIQFYISNTNGKTVTLYTQNGYVGEVHTTFTTGIGAINGLTAPAQYLVTGTSGTDFNISSVTATHTFNLPTASASNRGALSSTDWTTFNSKIGGSGTTNYVSKFTGSGTIGNSQIFDNATSVGIGTATPSGSYKLDVNGNINVSNAVNYSQGGTKYGWTYATAGAMAMEGLQGADISLGTGSGAVASERMVIKNSGNVGIGITPDSMLAVAQGTHLQRGVRMSGLPSAVGTKTLRIDASGTVSVADTGSFVPTSRTLTINGTTQDLTADRTWNVGTVTTAAATGGGQVAFFNGSTVLTSISTLYFDGVNKLAIGNSSPDSMLSVTQGAHIQRGVRLSGLPTAPGTRALRVDANGTLSVSDTLTNGISGSGTTNYIPKFTSSSAIGNSLLREGTNSIGLGYTPSSWSYTGFQINGAALHGSPTETDAGLSANAYYNSGWKYYANNYASQYRQVNGEHEFNVAGIGTAGNSVSFSTAIKILTSGNVGIGTTNPGYKLDVNGSIYTNQEFGYYFQRTSGIPSDLYSWSANAGSAYLYNHTTSNVLITFLEGGNVGIGTTNPQRALHVKSGAGTAQIESTATTSMLYFADANSTGIDNRGIGSAGNDLWFMAGATEKMRLDASGNLGLGVTPSAWWSGMTASQIGTGGAIYSANGSNDIYLINNAFYNGTNFKYVNSDFAGISGWNAGEFIWYQAPSGTAGNNISFTQAMTLFSTGNLAVGGTSDNGSRLNVTGDGYFSGTVTAANGLVSNRTADALSGQFLRSTINGTSVVNNGIILGKATSNNNAASIVYTHSSDGSTSNRLGFGFWGADNLLNLTASGNVGIGTANPGYALDIYKASGNLRIYNTSNPGTEATYSKDLGLILTSYYSASGSPFTRTADIVSNADAGAESQMRFFTATSASNPAERMRITSAGDVGIGTTSPSTTLTVKSTNDNGYALTRPSDATSLHWKLSTTETGGDAYTTRYNTFNNEMLFTTYASGGTGGNIIWRTGSSGAGTETERMRITSGGDVGINTQTPNATFHVNGSVAAAISIKTATYTLTSSDYTVVFDLNGNATANLPSATTCSGRIYVIKINRTNVSDVLTIDPNGAQTIDGNATYDLQCQQAITIQSDGSNWRIIGDYAAGVNCL